MDRVVALLWSIWKTQNGTVFRNELPNSSLTLIRAKQANAEWRIRHKVTHNFHPPNPKHSAFSHKMKTTYWATWRKPQGGFVKINFEGSKSSQGAEGGFIIRNWDGKFIQTFAFNLGASSVLIAEVTAMRNGLQVGVRTGYPNIHIEWDNKVLIHAVQRWIHRPWEIQILVQDILAYVQLCNKIYIHHIFREAIALRIGWPSLVVPFFLRSSGV